MASAWPVAVGVICGHCLLPAVVLGKAMGDKDPWKEPGREKQVPQVTDIELGRGNKDLARANNRKESLWKTR